jgi:transposase
LLMPSDDPSEQERRTHREQQRRQIRQERSVPVLQALKEWLGANNDALPRSKLGQAIGYARNNWEALSRYVEEGYLPIDNNLSERTLRVIALGRANWGVIGSEAGGENAAILYSIVGTCKHLGIDPFAYLRETLRVPSLWCAGSRGKRRIIRSGRH